MKWTLSMLAVVLTISCVALNSAHSLDVQGLAKKHQEYGEYLYELVTSEGNGYKTWKEGDAEFDFGPPAGAAAKTYLNSVAAASAEFPKKSCVVTEHFADGELTGITVRLKAAQGYDPRNKDWYWAHFLPDGKLATASPQKNPFAKAGFVTSEDDGRLWVFKVGSKALAKFAAAGEPAKVSIRPGVGPAGMSLKSSDQETIIEYLASKPGFVAIADDNRVWVFKEGSDSLKSFQKDGEPAKLASWPAAGPQGLTLKSADSETLAEYVASKPGFYTQVVDGRIWVFKQDSDDLKKFLQDGEPAKIAVRPSAGPRGMTVKGPDQETLLTYLLSVDGFHVSIDDGRAWVFRQGSDELANFLQDGEPAKIVVRPGAGPMGITVKGPDNETVDAFLRAFPQLTTPVATEAAAAEAADAAKPSASTTVASTAENGASKPVNAKFGKKGFFVQLDDGRLWVFREGSKELKEFRQSGEPAKIAIRPGAGPGGITLKGPDGETLLAYVAAKDGFETFIDDGRIWVFRSRSKELEAYKRDGEPAKIVVRPGAGPSGATVKAANNETLDAYLK